MADLSITAANVSGGTGFLMVTGTAGATITAGQAVYLSGTQWLLARANAAGTATVVGIALNNASSGQPINVLYGGIINIGATTVTGQTYALSAANAGGIAPITDLTTGNIVSILGVATSTSAIQIVINNSGAAHA